LEQLYATRCGLDGLGDLVQRATRLRVLDVSSNTIKARRTLWQRRGV
jgi:hypothetical protein